MNLPTLYQLSEEYLAAAEKMADLDLPAEVIHDTLEGMAGEIEVKAKNVAMVLRNMESVAELKKAAAKQLIEQSKAIDARAEHLRDYLKVNMQLTGIKKIESPWFAITLRDNPPSVVIDNEGEIPTEFLRIPPPPPAVPDKSQIASVLKLGGDVPGAHLVRTQRVDIR